MYAIIKTGGKQYRVQEGDSIFVEKLNADVDSNVVFDQVLAVVNDGDVKVGTPVVEGAKVTAKVLAQGKEKKESPRFQIQSKVQLPSSSGPSSAVHESCNRKD